MTDSVKVKPPSHDPSASTLSAADDRIVLSDWLPPQGGIVPQVRVGRRWISILWVLPIGAAVLVLLIALAQSLRELPSVQAFIAHYPGIAQAAPSVDTGFPWWLQLQHFLNMLFMMFIIRAGIQILADHPSLWGEVVARIREGQVPMDKEVAELAKQLLESGFDKFSDRERRVLAYLGRRLHVTRNVNLALENRGYGDICVNSVLLDNFGVPG